MVSRDSQSTRGVIAILTDFGPDSFYTGAMKAAMLAVDSSATIVDITHSVSPQAIDEGSFVLARVLDVFPPGTVFLAVVDPGVGGDRRNLIAQFGGRTVVAPDNGLVSDLMIEHGCEGCFAIRRDAPPRIRRHEAHGSTFMGRDVFGPIAAALAGGEPVDNLADPISQPVTVELPPIQIGERVLGGRVRYIDAFGNMLSNVSAAHIERAFGDHPRNRIRVSVGDGVEVRGINEYFSQRAPGELMAIINSWNILELSVNGGSASARLNGSTATAVRLDVV